MKKLLQSLFFGLGVMCLVPFSGQAAAGVFVRVPPPHPVVRYVAPAPAPRMAWVSGFYRWNGKTYIWMPGYWAHPPYPAAVWAPSRWVYQPSRGGYVFAAGYWHH